MRLTTWQNRVRPNQSNTLPVILEVVRQCNTEPRP